MEQSIESEFIKKYTLPGLKFKSGNSEYEVVCWKNKEEVIINYFGSYYPIPFKLIYHIMVKENKDLISNWSKNEQKDIKVLFPS